MGAVDEIAKEWFHHKVQFLIGSGASPYGGAAGEETPVDCHVRQEVRRIDTPEGQQTTTETLVYAPLHVRAERGDLLTLPEPFEPGPWQIIAKSVHHGAPLNLPNHQRFVCDVPADTDTRTGSGGGPYG